MIPFVRRHRREAVLVLLAAIAALGSMSLQDWGAWAAIIAAVITFLVVIVSVMRWAYRRWRFRRPLDLAELLFCKEPVGSDGWEPGRKLITTAVGDYKLTYTFRAKLDLAVDEVWAEFHGPRDGMPIDRGDSTVGVEDQRIAAYGNIHVMAFGRTRTLEQINRWPKNVAKGEDLSLARNVTTVAPWEGTLVLKARLHALDHANSKVHPVEISFRALGGEEEG